MEPTTPIPSEETEHILIDDVLLPSQLRKPQSSADKQLVLSVLKQAMDDYGARGRGRCDQTKRQSQAKVRMEVRAWIESDECSCDYFSFLQICDVLELDLSATRVKLREQMGRIDAGGALDPWWKFQEAVVSTRTGAGRGR